MIRFKTQKISLLSILKEDEGKTRLPTILDAVRRAHQVMTKTNHFFNLFLLHCFESNIELPKVDVKLLRYCFRIIGTCRKAAPSKDPRFKMLAAFHQQKEVSDLFPKEDLNYSMLSHLLEYSCIELLINYENNLKMHFVKRVGKYIDVAFGLYRLEGEERKLLRGELRKVKDDLLDVNKVETSQFDSDKAYHNWLHQTIPLIRPNRKVFENDSLYFDIHVNPWDYLYASFRVNIALEKEGSKTFAAVPMKTSLIPGYITIDNQDLRALFGPFKGLTTKEQWNQVFKTEKRVFKSQGLQFYQVIKTDGHACSVILASCSTIERKQQGSKQKTVEGEIYWEDVASGNEKEIVAIDPGKGNLLCCRGENTKKLNYTAQQKRTEMKTKVYDLRSRVLVKKDFGDRYQPNNLKDIENYLSTFRLNPSRSEHLKEVLKVRYRYEPYLRDSYEQMELRRIKWYRYIQNQKTEAKLLKNFKEKFGPPEETVIVMGDYRETNHMKYQSPTKGIGFRRLFRRRRYDLYLIDEFRTSALCSKCGCRNEKFLAGKKGYLNHHLLRCTNDSCSKWWNRDHNAAKNMLHMAKGFRAGKERPWAFDRSNVSRKKETTSTMGGETHRQPLPPLILRRQLVIES